MAESMVALIDGSFAVRMGDSTTICYPFDPMMHYEGGDKFRLNGEVYLVVAKEDVFFVKEHCWRFEKPTNLQLEYISEIEGVAQNNGIGIPKFEGTTKGEASDYIRHNEGLQYKE